jgi:hypothetical protein
LVLLGQELQAAFENVARSTTQKNVSERGALPKFLKVATDLEVSGIEKGSFSLTLSLPENEYSRLGEQALESLIAGLESLRERSKQLPARYNKRVLRAWYNIGRLFDDGVELITLDLVTTQRKTKVAYGLDLYSLISEQISRLISNFESLEGDLLMADFSRMRCRLHLPSGDTINCDFSQQLIDSVEAALRKYVCIEGIVYREATTKNVRRARIRNLKILNKAELDYPLIDEDDIDEELWLLAASRNPVFDDLYDSEEEVYSLSDGKPFHD